MDISNKKHFLTVTDYSVSKEIFDLYLDESLDMLITHPQPSLEVLGKYYESADYISHTDSKRTLFEKAYHLVKRNALNNKVNLIECCDDKIDLNIATQKQLQEVRGIGPALSARIISYRLKLGGFSVDKQLQSVWGLSERVVANVLGSFTVKTPKEIIQIAVNTASASDIATISGISYDLAKQIWEFRVLREKIVSLSELQKIEGMTTSKYALIELYLHVE